MKYSKKNGINTISLSALKDAVTRTENDSLAYFDVTTSWLGGLKSESACNSTLINGELSIATSNLIRADEPVQLGGEGLYPNPQELMLSAFNACIMAAYITAAVSEGITLEKLQIKTSSALDLSILFSPTVGISPMNEIVRYVITVKGSGTPSQFEHIHQTVIASSPNRWLIAQNMLIEGDQIIE
ncbi:OsmC family protein [Enterobacter soli]|uniref:OsmC family protein n=1 Tax=Enterobacter soli TaxID=885040 RepID=UPI003ED89EAE